MNTTIFIICCFILCTFSFSAGMLIHTIFSINQRENIKNDIETLLIKEIEEINKKEKSTDNFDTITILRLKNELNLLSNLIYKIRFY